MTVRRFLARRVLFALFSAYLVVSITFGFVALTADPQLGVVVFGAATADPTMTEAERAERVNEAVSAYKEAHNLDEPVEQRYVRWLVNIATFDWGESLKRDEAVLDLVTDAVPKTAAYVVPGVLFASVGGVLAGLYAAMRRNSPTDYLVTSVGYVGFSLPNFFVAEFVLLVGFLLFAPDGTQSYVWLRDHPSPVARTVVLPGAVLGVSLLANYLRYARAETLENLGETFVDVLRAKGASDWRVSRHIMRKATVPLVSLFVAELMTVLVVNVYVLEAVFGIDGLGTLSLTAIQDRDLPVVLGTTMVLVFVGIAGNLFQDVAAVFLDPRVAGEEL